MNNIQDKNNRRYCCRPHHRNGGGDISTTKDEFFQERASLSFGLASKVVVGKTNNHNHHNDQYRPIVMSAAAMKRFVNHIDDETGRTIWHNRYIWGDDHHHNSNDDAADIAMMEEDDQMEGIDPQKMDVEEPTVILNQTTIPTSPTAAATAAAAASTPTSSHDSRPHTTSPSSVIFDCGTIGCTTQQNQTIYEQPLYVIEMALQLVTDKSLLTKQQDKYGCTPWFYLLDTYLCQSRKKQHPDETKQEHFLNVIHLFIKYAGNDSLKEPCHFSKGILPVHMVAKSDDIPLIQTIVKACPEACLVKAPQTTQWYALHTACRHGQSYSLEKVKCIHEAPLSSEDDADETNTRIIEQVNEDGDTCLHLLCQPHKAMCHPRDTTINLNVRRKGTNDDIVEERTRARNQYQQVLQYVFDQYPQALLVKNHKGYTPFHLVAQAVFVHKLWFPPYIWRQFIRHTPHGLFVPDNLHHRTKCPLTYWVQQQFVSHHTTHRPTRDVMLPRHTPPVKRGGGNVRRFGQTINSLYNSHSNSSSSSTHSNKHTNEYLKKSSVAAKDVVVAVTVPPPEYIQVAIEELLDAVLEPKKQMLIPQTTCILLENSQHAAAFLSASLAYYRRIDNNYSDSSSLLNILRRVFPSLDEDIENNLHSVKNTTTTALSSSTMSLLHSFCMGLHWWEYTLQQLKEHETNNSHDDATTATTTTAIQYALRDLHLHRRDDENFLVGFDASTRLLGRRRPDRTTAASTPLMVVFHHFMRIQPWALRQINDDGMLPIHLIALLTSRSGAILQHEANNSNIDNEEQEQPPSTINSMIHHFEFVERPLQVVLQELLFLYGGSASKPVKRQRPTTANDCSGSTDTTKPTTSMFSFLGVGRTIKRRKTTFSEPEAMSTEFAATMSTVNDFPTSSLQGLVPFMLSALGSHDRTLTSLNNTNMIGSTEAETTNVTATAADTTNNNNNNQISDALTTTFCLLQRYVALENMTSCHGSTR